MNSPRKVQILLLIWCQIVQDITKEIFFGTIFIGSEKMNGSFKDSDQ